MLLFAIFSVLIISTGGLVHAQEDNVTETTSGPKFLSIQNAESGSIAEINSTTYTLELNDVSDKLILFSDRPDRIVTSISTSDFIGNWTTGQDSFAADPPNAALVVIDDITGEEEDTAIIELLNPIYDIDTKTLQYEVIALNATGISIPSEFGEATLVIDVF